MSVVDEYLATVADPERTLLEHMYALVRTAVPDATEELSYNMPAFKWQGKGLIAIMANKEFMSIYPFCNVETLGLDTSGFETTKGSVHFTPAHPVPDDFLRTILGARQKQIRAR